MRALQLFITGTGPCGIARRATAAAFFVALLMTATAPPAAGDAPPAPAYRAAGAPPAPKVEARWNRYYDHAEATELMQQLAEAHPDLVTLESIGESHQGRELWLMTLTDRDTGEPGQKPAFWIDGAIHGNELQATEVVLYTAWYLLEMHGHNDFITRLLADRTFYLMPMLSPDARDHHMHAPNTTHTPRTGLVDFDDLDVHPMGFEDIDGDGHIKQMRVRDPDGRHIPHPDFPDLMIEAPEDERGEYRLLGWERRIQEDADHEDLRRRQYDPNRDWPWQWKPPYLQRGAHRYPFSLPENRAVADFVLARPNIAGAQSYHNVGGMILRGPGAPDDEYARQDVRLFDTIGQRGETIIPGYDYMELGRDLYPGHGVELDWFYAMRGAVTFTNELFTGFNLFRDAADGRMPQGETLHKFDRFLLFGDGIAPWREVDHPDLGAIEVGGVKSHWVRQPPAFLLEEECHRNMAFTLYHADQMPLVRLRDVTVERIGEDVTQVTATVANDRMIPTRLAVDMEHEITPPDRVRIVSDDDQPLDILAALVSEQPYFHDPTEQDYQRDDVRVERIPGLDALHVRWLIRGEPDQISVRVHSHKGGTHRVVVEDDG